MESKPYLKMWKDDTIILLLSYNRYIAQYYRSQKLLKNSGYKRAGWLQGVTPLRNYIILCHQLCRRSHRF